MGKKSGEVFEILGQMFQHLLAMIIFFLKSIHLTKLVSAEEHLFTECVTVICSLYFTLQKLTSATLTYVCSRAVCSCPDSLHPQQRC